MKNLRGRLFSASRIKVFSSIASIQFTAQALNFISLFYMGKVFDARLFSDFYYSRLALILFAEFIRFSFEKDLIKRNSPSINLTLLLIMTLITSISAWGYGWIGSFYFLTGGVINILFLKEKVRYNYNQDFKKVNLIDLFFHGTFPVLLVFLILITSSINYWHLVMIDTLRLLACAALVISWRLRQPLTVAYSFKRNYFQNIIQFSLNYFRNNPIIIINWFNTNLEGKSILILFSSLSDLFKNRIVPIFQIILFGDYKYGSQIKKILIIVGIGIIFQLILFSIPETIIEKILHNFVEYKPVFGPLLSLSISILLYNLIGVEIRFSRPYYFENVFSSIIILYTSFILFNGISAEKLLYLTFLNFTFSILSWYYVFKIKKTDS